MIAMLLMIIKKSSPEKDKNAWQRNLSGFLTSPYKTNVNLLHQLMLPFCRFIGQNGDTEVTLNVSKFNCGGENTIQYLERVVVIIKARFDRRRCLEGYLT